MMGNTRFSGDNLKEIIDANKEKAQVKRLAEEIGVSEGTLYNWMRGQGEPSLTEATELALCLGVELDAFRETV